MNNFDFLHSKLTFYLLLLLSVTASVYLFGYLFSFLSQFNWLFIILIYAYIIYILIAPLNNLIQKLEVPAKASLAISFLIIFSIFILVIVFLNPILAQELSKFADQLGKTDFNGAFGNFIDGIAHLLNVDSNQVRTTIFDNVKNFGVNTANNLVGVLSNAVFTLAQLILAFIIGYFFIKDGKSWFKGFLRVVPKQYRNEFDTIANYFNKSATSFFRVQVFMALIYGIINYVIMSILGIDFALSASLIAFITFIIPGLGPVLSMIVPVGVTLLFSPNKILLLIIILLIFQQLILNIIIPKVYGDKMGIHPIIIILSILVGIQLFGVLGAFVVIPVIAVTINVASIYINKAVRQS